MSGARKRFTSVFSISAPRRVSKFGSRIACWPGISKIAERIAAATSGSRVGSTCARSCPARSNRASKSRLPWSRFRTMSDLVYTNTTRSPRSRCNPKLHPLPRFASYCCSLPSPPNVAQVAPCYLTSRIVRACSGVMRSAPRRPTAHFGAYCISPLPNDQSSRDVSTRLIHTSSLRTPPFA
jgi:hypothetical protein